MACAPALASSSSSHTANSSSVRLTSFWHWNMGGSWPGPERVGASEIGWADARHSPYPEVDARD